MHPLLYRASGHDFANLWMNMAKIVIALVFLYQNALDTQLGVRLFQDYYYVFHVPVSHDPEGGAVGSTEVVTPEDPYFSIEFKPLALGQAYEDFTVEVLELTNSQGEDLLKTPPASRGLCGSSEPGCVSFSWDDLTGGDKAVLHRASFNLLELVKDESALVSGDYQVQFGFKFLRDGRLLGGRGQSSTYAGTLKFLRKEELRFGDVPVVQGRPFRLPKLILDRLNKGGFWGGWDAYREVRVLEGGSDSGWKSGPILKEDFGRGWLRPVRRLAPAKNYEQRGHYLDENNLQVDFTIGFNLLRNEPPRSTYLGPGESDIHFVRIFYEWHFFEEDQGYFYYNLSRHIIDPDGTTAPIDGRPDVRVREFVKLQPESLPYRLHKDRLTGDWHLRVLGKIEDSLPPGSSHELSVL
ncbi:hypothetical protein MYX65_09525, partial [Acidobacteria bacterium AH-259-L09]|nr:hypothetical protein [Acidobacteria bacterium AH-259-L09]